MAPSDPLRAVPLGRSWVPFFTLMGLLMGPVLFELPGQPSSVAAHAGHQGFSSGNLGQGATFAQVFEDPGSYEYACVNHGNMSSAFRVEPGASLGGDVTLIIAGYAYLLSESREDARGVTVAPGTKITWLNEDDDNVTGPHTVDLFSFGELPAPDEESTPAPGAIVTLAALALLAGAWRKRTG